MKLDNYIRDVAESFSMEVNDAWGNENALLLQGLGMRSKRKENENDRRVLANLVAQIPYDKKYSGIACFYELENGEGEVKDRIKALMETLKNNLDQEEDEMALVFYAKYETVLGGKEHYQDLFNRYVKAYERPQKNNAYYMTAVIEGIDSINQMLYEYYDGLKTLFKNTLRAFMEEEETDLTDKALAAFAISKACRLKVILAEKYEVYGKRLMNEVMEHLDSTELNKGAVVMLMAESALH